MLKIAKGVNGDSIGVHELNVWEFLTNFKEFGISISNGKSELDGIFCGGLCVGIMFKNQKKGGSPVKFEFDRKTGS